VKVALESTAYVAAQRLLRNSRSLFEVPTWPPFVGFPAVLKATGLARPVGRPPKSEVQRHIAIEARIAKKFEDDINRLRLVTND
jgi:hypothetical protein